MSEVRRQALINAPPSRIWELVGDPQRHPEWWPRVIEVRGEKFNEGSNYAQVTKEPTGSVETTMRVEHLEDLREIRMRCMTTGTYSRWLLTEAQGNTFVDVEFGMDPIGLRHKIMDATIAPRYFRNWLEQSLEALDEIASRPDEAGSAVGGEPHG